MAALGRPTPQAPVVAATADEPLFRERDLEGFDALDTNPFVLEHRAFGRPLLTVDDAHAVGRRWDAEFGGAGALHLEIGSGNGFFLSGMARLLPSAHFVGIEIRYKRTVLCARKIRAAGVQNARILRYHAAFLHDLFRPGSLTRIYVNHPDPWPKERHEKNRLLSRWFLEDVATLLVPGGVFRLKTDHAPNVERARAVLAHGPDGEDAPHLPLVETAASMDVTTTPLWPDDVETNYQRKFRERGLPVYALELTRTAASWPLDVP
jgi:tRNA (guanine-N7-)-methyltransferase